MLGTIYRLIWTKGHEFCYVFEIDGQLVIIYHGGTVESDRYGYVEFSDMQSVPVLFNYRPSFSEMVARVKALVWFW